VNYQFAKRGQVTVPKNSKTLDDIFILAADHGAEDVEEIDEEVVVYTIPEDLN